MMVRWLAGLVLFCTLASGAAAGGFDPVGGSGDRSDKIRTYNYPQNRVTDHRINLTLYNLDQIMEGQIGEILQALQLAENASRMEAQAG